MPTNNIEAMWDRQKDFQKNFFNPDLMSEEEKITFTKEFILSIHRELGEVLNIMPWKIHRANHKEYDVEHMKEELIDCFKFLANVCIIWGMSAKEFEALFYKKSDIVEERYRVEIAKKS